MGQSKWRKQEIALLKQNTPEETARWRQLQNDKRLIQIGLDPESHSIEIPAAAARALSALLTEAKRTGNVDAPVTLLHNTIDATVAGMSDIPIACKKGCSHCCHTWVSVSAPEALYIARLLKDLGESVVAKVRSTHELTKDYDFDTRDQHPHPCPLLDDDVCSIYENRPKVCRLASSADAEICGRSYHRLTDEDIPTPQMYLNARVMYAIVMSVSLRHANLPHHGYEFNAALVRALDTDDAEQRWLGGEDIFSEIPHDSSTVLNDPLAKLLYEHAFANR